MGDNNLDDKKKYDAINPDSIIDVKINGRFFGDLRALMISRLVKGRTKEEIGKVLENFNKQKVESEEEHEIFILLHLVLGIEAAAKEQGYIFKASIPDDPTADL